MKWFVTLIILISCPGFSKVKAPKTELSAGVSAKLDSVLNKADGLRQALVERNESIAMARLKDLENALGEAVLASDPDNQTKQHLNRILNDARVSLQQFTVLNGEEKRASLQNAFKQIVLIGQNYKLKENFRFFFCQRDRSVWLQKDTKPKNPINPEAFLNCGTRVE